MQKEARKCDSVRVALDKKNVLVLELIESNLEMFSQFTLEREKKNEAMKAQEAAKKQLDKFDRKRFGVGLSAGATLNSDFKVKPAILIGVSYSLFRF